MSMRFSPSSRWALLLIVALAIQLTEASAQSSKELEQGMAEFRAGNYAAAAGHFEHVEAPSPGATDALLYEAKCFVHLEDFPRAETALRSYLGVHRDSADATYLLGFVLHRENRPAESLAVYAQAAALVRPTGDDLKIVGLDYVLLNDYPDAIKWLERAVEFDSRNKDAWYYLGRAYYTRARLVEAKKAFLAVLEIDPKDSRAENNLGLVLESDAQPAAAIEAYNKAIEWGAQKQHPSEQPYVNLGNLLVDLDRTEEAIPPLEKAVALAPNNGFCRLKLGTAYLHAGKLESARTELEKATSLDPENPAAHYQLGRLYKAIHALDRAQEEFRRTAELQSRASGPQTAPSNH